jgi:tetratricopeptide (TPR) repeat protein
VSTQIDNTLISQVKAALATDAELAKKVVRELSDKQDLLERMEDTISERSELVQALEIAQIQIEDLAAKGDLVDSLTAEVTELKAAISKGLPIVGEKLSEDAFGANGAASSADYREISEECENLREIRKDLEDELTLRDEIIASLRDDFQGAHGGPSGDADFDALLAEKNNLSDQLTLSLSQLDQVTDREGLVVRVDGLTRQAEELQSRLEQSLAENNQLQNKLDETKEQLKSVAVGGSSGNSPVGHSPGAIVTVLILIIVVGYTGFQTLAKKTLVKGTVPTVNTLPSSVAEGYVLPLEEIEFVAFQRLRQQQMTLDEVLALRSPERVPAVSIVKKGIEKAIESDSPYRKVLALIAVGQFPEAIEAFTAVDIELKKARARFVYLTGRTNFLAGHIAEALRLLRMSVELSPELVDGWRSLGDLYVFQDNVEQATFCYGEALKADENDALTLAALGAVYSLNDEVGKAIKYFTKSVESDSSLAKSWYALGMLYQRAEDYGKAAKTLERAIVLDPDSAQTHFALGHCYKILGKADLAKHHKDRAVNLGYQDAGPAGETSSGG